MKAPKEDSHINIDDIPLLQGTQVRNTVANLLVRTWFIFSKEELKKSFLAGPRRNLGEIFISDTVLRP